jgi:hypothetical protein
MTLTYLQQLWLNSRGGRTIKDVIVIDGELFIAMRSGGMWIPILIPSDRTIKIFHRVVLEKYRRKRLVNR